MGDIRQEFKRNAEIRCSAVDEITSSPPARTKQVLNLLVQHGNFDNWDMICFCVLYLGSQLAVVPEFQKPIEHLALLMNNAHYMKGSDFGLYDEAALEQLINLRKLNKTGDKIENTDKGSNSE